MGADQRFDYTVMGDNVNLASRLEGTNKEYKSHVIISESTYLLAKDGIHLDYMRVRGFPFGDDVRKFIEQHNVNFVVEQNRDAQLRSLLMLDLGIHIEKLHSVRYYAGFPMSAHHVINGVKAKLEKAA